MTMNAPQAATNGQGDVNRVGRNQLIMPTPMWMTLRVKPEP